ncbi:ATP synthase F1 subunit delta [Alloiococcus sp. CFN-8]|uniref:ATP synthase F1 subunit delta n=1 Tax=Alloiococcus sp. CFN-8 TaxID=3416081 RepID=UPI003CFB19CE
MGSIISKNYGEALISIAEEADSLKEYKEELQSLRDRLDKNQELLKVMDIPWISKKDKKEILRKVFSSDGYIMNFIELLVDKNRFSYLEEICEEFIDRANEKLNIQVVEVTSAVELERKELKEIKKLLEKKLGTDIDIRTVVDRSYIAGMRVKIKDKVLDNTVLSKLEAIKERITKVVI